MPKQAFPVRGFRQGMYGNADRRDLPDGSAAYTENVDGSVPGRVRGIRQSSEVSTSFDPRIMIAKRFGTPEIIGQDSAKQVKSREVNTGTETNVGSPTSNFISSMVAQAKDVYCGTTTTFKGSTPGGQLWIGQVDHEQFNNGASASRVVDSAGIQAFIDEQNDIDQYTSPKLFISESPTEEGNHGFDYSFRFELDETASEGAFSKEVRYFYAISLVYDGATESPLIRGYFRSNGDFVYFSQTVTNFSEFNGTEIRLEDAFINRAFGTLTVSFDSFSDFPERITGINLYRAENPETGEKTPSTQYRFVTNFDINADDDDGFFDNVTNTELDPITDDTQEYQFVLSSGITDSATSFDIDISNDDQMVCLSPSVGDIIRIDIERMEVTGVSHNSDDSYTLTVARGYGGDATGSHSTGAVVTRLFGAWISTDGNGMSGTFAGGASFFALRWIDDGDQGATYEDRTGRPGTLETVQVDYKLSTDYNSQLFVGVCAVDGVDDANQYIYRSAPNAYGTFNTAEDFLPLPEEPTALIGFGGRMYAFSETNMYRINPQGLYVEDTFHGVGSLNEDTVIVTNYGMFHADENNIYLNDGNRSTPIGEPILRVMAKPNKNYGWREMAKTVSGSDQYARLAFDPETRRLLVFGASESDGSETVCWAYDVIRERWDLYVDIEMPLAAANTPDGTLQITADDGSSGLDLVSLFTNSSRYNWSVISPSLTLGPEGVEKFIYEINGQGTGGFTFEYEIDESGTFVDPGTADDDGDRAARIVDKDKVLRSVAVRVSSASSTDELDNFRIIFRPKQVAS